MNSQRVTGEGKGDDCNSPSLVVGSEGERRMRKGGGGGGGGGDVLTMLGLQHRKLLERRKVSP